MNLSLADSGLLEELEKQTRRSRLSLHLNTRKRRRWLLIQLVSIPVSNLMEEERENSLDDEASPRSPGVLRSESWPDTYSRVLDNYTNTLHMNLPK